MPGVTACILNKTLAALQHQLGSIADPDLQTPYEVGQLKNGSILWGPLKYHISSRHLARAFHFRIRIDEKVRAQRDDSEATCVNSGHFH